MKIFTTSFVAGLMAAAAFAQNQDSVKISPQNPSPMVEYTRAHERIRPRDYDGLHASYMPERKVLAEGGVIDSTGLVAFIRFAYEAAQPESGKKFLITHSEIFPGTFVSTTEASDFILKTLGIKRDAVLKWGPLGMQQLSVARRGRFEVQGFAGNTAPDHVDHLHALGEFLRQLP